MNLNRSYQKKKKSVKFWCSRLLLNIIDKAVCLLAIYNRFNFMLFKKKNINFFLNKKICAMIFTNIKITNNFYFIRIYIFVS